MLWGGGALLSWSYVLLVSVQMCLSSTGEVFFCGSEDIASAIALGVFFLCTQNLWIFLHGFLHMVLVFFHIPWLSGPSIFKT